MAAKAGLILLQDDEIYARFEQLNKKTYSFHLKLLAFIYILIYYISFLNECGIEHTFFRYICCTCFMFRMLVHKLAPVQVYVST